MASDAAGPLARQALDLAKNALLVSLRFMNAAFARLHPFPVPGATLATDGLHLRYDPLALARLYAAEPNELTRAYLHIVLHNVFLHPYPGEHVDAARWDAACDIVVEPARRAARANRRRSRASMPRCRWPPPRRCTASLARRGSRVKSWPSCAHPSTWTTTNPGTA